MNFRLASNSKGDAGVSQPQALGRLISHLALGWAHHIVSTHTPDAPDSVVRSNLHSAHAVLNNCDAWRLSHTELRVGGPLWPRALHGAKQPGYVATVNGGKVAAPVAADISVDVCTPGASDGEQVTAACTFQQCDAGPAEKHPDSTGLEVELVPLVMQPVCVKGDQNDEAEGACTAPVLLLVPGYGNESTIGGEWVQMHQADHNGAWSEQVQGTSMCCTWSQESPIHFCNSQVGPDAMSSLLVHLVPACNCLTHSRVCLTTDCATHSTVLKGRCGLCHTAAPRPAVVDNCMVIVSIS